ncbi:MAG: hypothetical protein KatS3mg090_0949 [Patescibacteria group bacterium]|nr:MAG: hypothetical protein KatS3mg090_0949 [Patescibacteria group bacterium]
MKKKYNINLLEKQSTDIYQAVFVFTLGFFKHILVITQIIILAVFLYRMKIDIEISDSLSMYYSNKEIVESSQDMVKDYQAKSKLISDIGDKLTAESLESEALKYLLSVFPQNFLLYELSYSGSSYSLRGLSFDYATIMKFYNRLKSDGFFEEVGLDSIQRSEYGFNFVFKLTNFKTKTNEGSES